MDALRSPLFITCSILFLLHQLLQYVFNIFIPFIDAYLDNLVAMPIILVLLVAERRFLFKRGSSYYLPLLEVFLATIYISVLSEFVFPALSSRFVYDPFDFFFFFAGAVLFVVTENIKRKKEVV